jgi:DNA-binding NarL/FixJ family response regulator
MTIRIQLAEDHMITREGLKSLIRNETHMEVVAEVDNGRSAVTEALRHIPDIIIMDINMPGLNGIEATRQILAQHPHIKVIALSMFSERRYVMGMLKAGVSGYLLKNCAFSELLDAIETVSKGSRYLSQQITDMVMDDFVMGRPVDDFSQTVLLTKREREVLQLIAEGVSSVRIATRLHVSEKTVFTHRRKIMDKLNIHTIAGLTKFAIREGMTTLDA